MLDSTFVFVVEIPHFIFVSWFYYTPSVRRFPQGRHLFLFVPSLGRPMTLFTRKSLRNALTTRWACSYTELSPVPSSPLPTPLSCK